MNVEYKVRPVIININSNEPVFYPYNVLVNKCSDSCKYTNNRMLYLMQKAVKFNDVAIVSIKGSDYRIYFSI